MFNRLLLDDYPLGLTVGYKLYLGKCKQRKTHYIKDIVGFIYNLKLGRRQKGMSSSKSSKLPPDFAGACWFDGCDDACLAGAWFISSGAPP